MLILTLARTEMRNMLLETRGKAILVRKWQKTWLNYVLKFCRKQNLWVMTLVIWQRRAVSKVLKVQPGFSLLITVKYEGREIMAIFFFFNQKEPETEHCENSRFIILQKMRKCVLKTTSKVWLDKQFHKDITHGYNQQKPEILMGLYQQTV